MRLRDGAALLALLLISLPTSADTGGSFGQWQYSAGVLLDQYSDGPPPEWSFGIGAGADLSPRYDGASGRRLEGYPLGEIRYRDSAYASVSEGIGFNLLHRQNQRIGVSLNWDFGRRSTHIDDARGVDSIRSGPVADLYAEQVIFPVVLRADLRHSAVRDYGFRGELGAYLPLPIGKSIVVFAGPSVILADGNAERTQYGVSDADAARSGFPAFHAGGGLEATRVGINAVWLIDDHWVFEAIGAWTHLYDAAADSPLTRRQDNFSFGVALAYGF